MKLIPNAKKLLVKQDKAPEKIGLIIMPDSLKEKQRTGTVCAAGKECTYKEGDKVFFNNYLGTPFKFDGIDYLMFEDKDIYGEIR